MVSEMDMHRFSDACVKDFNFRPFNDKEIERVFKDVITVHETMPTLLKYVENDSRKFLAKSISAQQGDIRTALNCLREAVATRIGYVEDHTMINLHDVKAALDIRKHGQK